VAETVIIEDWAEVCARNAEPETAADVKADAEPKTAAAPRTKRRVRK